MRNDKLIKNIYDFAGILVTAILTVGFIFAFIAKTSIVDGRSMTDTLQHGDRILITAINQEPKYRDIVVISQPNDYNKVLIKRVIATGGQMITIDATHGAVIVDGQVLSEPYIREITRVSGDMHYPLRVPKGYVFVMGDNRNESGDSRYRAVGLIDERYIVGKAFYRLGDKGLLNRS